MDHTFSPAVVKYISYFSEEYVKQLLEKMGGGKVTQLDAFVGSVIYPGKLFPPVDSNIPTRQFQDTTYVGLMQFIFPAETSTIDDLPAYTVLQFELDGLTRTFITVAGGDILAGTTPFSDYVAAVYPDANNPMPFNESAIHTLRNIQISGSKFNVVDDEFVPTGLISGSHTLDYQFCCSVSGYAALIQ